LLAVAAALPIVGLGLVVIDHQLLESHQVAVALLKLEKLQALQATQLQLEQEVQALLMGQIPALIQ